MNHRLVTALADAVAPVIREAYVRAVQPLIERIAAIEARGLVKGEKGDPGEAGAPGEIGPQGERGEKGDPGEAGPPGQPGADGKDGLPGEKGDPGEAGPEGVPGRDGQPGTPGPHGRDGKDGAPGAAGKDGRDGLGFDDIDVQHDGDGGFTFRFVRGDEVREFGKFQLPRFIDRGVWSEGSFKAGDGVTWGGSFWIAQRETTAKPDSRDSGWRLAVKRGADGRDGKPGEKGERGDKGDRGDRGVPGYAG